MTRREWQIVVGLIVTAGIVGVLCALTLTVLIDRHTDRSRPETPITNQSQMGAQ